MSEIADLNNWKYMPYVVGDFQYEDWMGLAESVSNMMYRFNGNLVDLSIKNFIYNIKTKDCWLLDITDIADDGDIIKQRWYPARVRKSPDDMVYFTEEIAARVVLEFMYGKSVFFHEDVETYRNNVRCMTRTAGTPAPKDRKAAWMFMFTAFAAHNLSDGEDYLLDLERKEDRDPDEVIATWKDVTDGWGPDDDSVWYQAATQDVGEQDSLTQSDANSDELSPGQNDSGDSTHRDGELETLAERSCDGIEIK